MGKLLSIETLYYDGGFDAIESEETVKSRDEFYEVCLNPIFEDNCGKGHKIETLYGESTSYNHWDGFIAGFRAAVSLLLDSTGQTYKLGA